jgi:SAM-dependent MidA family methyltransferase
MQLSEIIAARIRTEGPITFRDFMDMCLYHPEAGYYTAWQDSIGMNGDFYTTSNISPVFGAMMGRQLEEMWTLTGRKKFMILEYGAGTGMLCHDILDYLKKNPEFYSQLQYGIIEKSPVMRARQKHLLKEKVSWYDSIRDIAPVTGCVLSNELVDNFPVHRVVMDDGLKEIFVDHSSDEGFFEIERPAGQRLVNYFSELGVVLPAGFRTEVNLDALDWIQEIAASIEGGYAITIDYGYSSAELYNSRRSEGTLQCYYQHSVNNRPFENIGKQDITAHVNFSALSHWGSKRGLVTTGFTRQASFLVGLGWEDYLREILMQPGDGYMNFRQYATLKSAVLMDLGQFFKVLVQAKGVQAGPLRGFMHEAGLPYQGQVQCD